MRKNTVVCAGGVCMGSLLGSETSLAANLSLTSVGDVVDDALELDRRAGLARPQCVGVGHRRHLVLAERRRRRWRRRRGHAGRGRPGAAAPTSTAAVAVHLGERMRRVVNLCFAATNK